MLRIFYVLFMLVFTSEAAWDIPCDNLTLLQDVNLTKFEGAWRAVALYHNDLSIPTFAETLLCNRLELEQSEDGKMNLTLSVIAVEVMKPLVEPFVTQITNLEHPGIWDNLQHQDPSDALRVMEADVDSYFVAGKCKKNEETKEWIIDVVLLWKRNGTVVSKEKLRQVKEFVTASINVPDVGVIIYDQSC